MIHPVLTPEYYKKYPLQPNNVVKALYLSSQKGTSPQILTDTPANIISLFFPDLKPKCLFLLLILILTLHLLFDISQQTPVY